MEAAAVDAGVFRDNMGDTGVLGATEAAVYGAGVLRALAGDAGTAGVAETTGAAGTAEQFTARLAL